MVSPMRLVPGLQRRARTAPTDEPRDGPWRSASSSGVCSRARTGSGWATGTGSGSGAGAGSGAAGAGGTGRTAVMAETSSSGGLSSMLGDQRGRRNVREYHDDPLPTGSQPSRSSCSTSDSCATRARTTRARANAHVSGREVRQAASAAFPGSPYGTATKPALTYPRQRTISHVSTVGLVARSRLTATRAEAGVLRELPSAAGTVAHGRPPGSIAPRRDPSSASSAQRLACVRFETLSFR